MNVSEVRQAGKQSALTGTPRGDDDAEALTCDSGTAGAALRGMASRSDAAAKRPRQLGFPANQRSSFTTLSRSRILRLGVGRFSIDPDSDSVRSKSGFAHTNEYPISVQSGRANDTATAPVSRQKEPRLRHRGEASSFSTAQAETPRPRDRPGEYTPHVRLYPAHAYPIQNVATALQSAHSGRRRSLRVFLGLARVPVHK